MHVRPGVPGETAAAMVAHLRPGRPRELTATVWSAFGSPCLSVFRPVYPFAVGLPAELDRGGRAYDPASPWWAFERLQRIVAQAPDLAAIARSELGALEAQLRAEAAEAEAEAARRLAAGDRAGAIEASNKAKTWTIVSVVVGLALGIIIAIVTSTATVSHIDINYP
jgi:dipeptidase